MQQYGPFNPYDLSHNSSTYHIPDDGYNSYKPHASDTSLEPLHRNTEGFSAEKEHLSSATARHFAVPLTARLPALLTAMGSGGLGIALIVWLFMRRYDERGAVAPVTFPSSELVVLEPSKSSGDDPNATLLVGLIISSVATQFINLTSTLLLGVAAYRLGVDWYEAANHRLPHSAERDLMTPLQYGFLVNMFSSSSWKSLVESGSYLSQRRTRPKAPQIFLRGFICLALVMGLARLVGLADLALHSTTTAVTVQSVARVDPSHSNYGTILNDTIRTNHSTDTFPQLNEGIRVATNSSTQHQVLSLELESQMAYISRPSSNIPANVSFIAPSFGIVSQCQAITPQCFNASMTHDVFEGQPLYASNTSFDCTPAGYPDYVHVSNASIADALSLPRSQVDGGRDLPTGQDGLNLTQNPFTAVYQRLLSAGPPSYPFNNSIIRMRDPRDPNHLRGFIMVACNVSVYGITLQFTSGEYTLINKTLLPPSEVAALTIHTLVANSENMAGVYYSDYYSNMIPLEEPIVPRFSSDIEVSQATDAAAFGQELSADISRLFLAYSAGYLTNTTAHSVSTSGVVTQYPFIPLAINLFFIFLYSTLAFFIFVWASLGRITVPTNTSDHSAQYGNGHTSAVDLARNAQLRISKPSTLVAALFPSSPNAGRMDGWAIDNHKELFTHGEAEQMTRLRLGLRSSYGKVSYGVWKADGEDEA